MTKLIESALPSRLDIVGLTKREWLTGMIASGSHTIWDKETKEDQLRYWAEAIVDHADALIAELAKGEGK